ncbi:hypothetical protein A3Q56_01765 [Intoshia linei]|uniref:MICOS complex subunit MIC60 n=1 Tax=Intoshia linei TaxID=1819745 RepID=A0A177B897_9BILA|nr:hypothetical protein A3Q56_01765 [Intoshia linei]
MNYIRYSRKLLSRNLNFTNCRLNSTNSNRRKYLLRSFASVFTVAGLAGATLWVYDSVNIKNKFEYFESDEFKKISSNLQTKRKVSEDSKILEEKPIEHKTINVQIQDKIDEFTKKIEEFKSISQKCDQVCNNHVKLVDEHILSCENIPLLDDSVDNLWKVVNASQENVSMYCDKYKILLNHLRSEEYEIKKLINENKTELDNLEKMFVPEKLQNLNNLLNNVEEINKIILENLSIACYSTHFQLAFRESIKQINDKVKQIQLPFGSDLYNSKISTIFLQKQLFNALKTNNSLKSLYNKDFESRVNVESVKLEKLYEEREKLLKEKLDDEFQQLLFEQMQKFSLKKKEKYDKEYESLMENYKINMDNKVANYIETVGQINQESYKDLFNDIMEPLQQAKRILIEVNDSNRESDVRKKISNYSEFILECLHGNKVETCNKGFIEKLEKMVNVQLHHYENYPNEFVELHTNTIDILKSEISQIKERYNSTSKLESLSFSTLRNQLQKTGILCKKLSKVPQHASIMDYIYSFVSYYLTFKSPIQPSEISVDLDLPNLDNSVLLAIALEEIKKDNIDTSARAVNNMSGQPREILQDWLIDARHHLTIYNLIQILKYMHKF